MVQDDIYWLKHALQLAQNAAAQNEVPVGAVVIIDNQIVGEGYNQPIMRNDPTAHAEIVALRNAAKKIGNYRLINASLYVTLEPCAMCAGALLNARLKRLVFGAHDHKAGAIMSKYALLDLPQQHKIDWRGGVLTEPCVTLLQNFFKARR